MQSTYAPGSTLCGALLPDGTDCPNPAHDEAPINLCPYHLVQATVWVNQNDESRRPREVCPLCGEQEARRDESGVYCGRCGYESPGFSGFADLTPAERDETHPKVYGHRKINVVYYIRFADRIKIGTTKDPRKRFQAIPHDEVLAFELGGVALESQRHIEFREHRIRNTEWFEIAQPILDHIATIQPKGEDPWRTYLRILPHSDTRDKEVDD